MSNEITYTVPKPLALIHAVLMADGFTNIAPDGSGKRGSIVSTYIKDSIKIVIDYNENA